MQAPDDPAYDTPETTPRRELDDALQRLTASKEAWVGVSIEDRIEILRRCIDGVLQVADVWVDRASIRRRFDPGSPLPGEEWIAGPLTVVRWMRLMIRTLRAGGQPRPRLVSHNAAGQPVARVFPADMLDRLLYYGMQGDIWIEPDKPASQGRIYRDKKAGIVCPGRVALVLGAGNVSSIPPLDLLYKLFAEDQVVLLKMNPVNAFLGPLLERAFGPLVREGYLAIVYGGVETGGYLCHHAQVETLHLTGSDHTYDAILWGTDTEEREARKAADRPLIDKPFTAELGCVSPILVVPGRWSRAALDYQARHVAGMVTHNASFNCNAGKLLVLSRDWSQREPFLDRLKAALARTTPRYAYYPGAEQRYRAFIDRYPEALALGRGGEGVVPWTLIPGVPPRDGEYALVTEAFCGLLAQVDVESDGPEPFLERAVEFVNDSVWGTLSCSLLVDGATQRAHGKAVERAVAGLRYGAVGVNVWAGVIYAFGTLTWGAYPGHTPQAIGSGQGVVHNTLLFDHPQKSVLRAAFRLRPKPVWFPDHRTLLGLGSALTEVEAKRSPLALVRTAFHGVRG